MQVRLRLVVAGGGGLGASHLGLHCGSASGCTSNIDLSFSAEPTNQWFETPDGKDQSPFRA